MAAFEKKLNEALGLVTEDDDISKGSEDSKPINLEGEKKKSAKGTHRPDTPTEYTEFKREDEEFKNNPHEHSEQARPDLD